MGGAHWFDEARFGMFVHWDHASQQGLEVSWPLVAGVFALPKSQKVSVEQYHSSAATFDPVEWDASALARLARDAGMKYAVLTTKHHSGYCMWPTTTDTWSTAISACGGRDFVGEFTDAFRAEGLRVGLYYSLADWHHADYPAVTEADKPYRFGQTPPYPGDERFARFRAVLFDQVRELLTDYGAIDLIWFDGGWERTPDQWQSAELERLIRSLQPDILINDRLPGATADFTTPEQFVPPTAPGGRWETCLTMNDSWGWCPGDTDYKSARDLVQLLCEVAGRGGNLLLNVSPTGTGALPVEQRERLDAVAGWMASHGPAITATAPGFDAWQFYGPSTRRGDRWYLLSVLRPYDSLTVRGVPIKRVRRCVDVAGDAELSFTTRGPVFSSLLPDPIGEVRIDVPPDRIDDLCTVVALDIEPTS